MARTCRGLTAPTTSAPRHWNAESGQQQDLTPKGSERPRRSANVGVTCGAHTSDGAVRRGILARRSTGVRGQSRGRGLSRANDFFLRGAFTRPKREKESDGCPQPLHPPPAGMQAYAVACMPQSTRRRLRSHRRLLFRKPEVSKGVSQTKASEFQNAFRKERLQAADGGAPRASRRAFGRAGFDKIWRDFSVVQHASASRHGGAPAAGLAASRLALGQIFEIVSPRFGPR